MNATLPGTSLKDFSRVLSCFAKIGDELSLEVRAGKLQLSTLNSSKSAFVLITLNATRFEKFEYLPQPTDNSSSLRCKLQLRALLSIFRSRNIESKDTRESSVEKCELKLLHPSEDTTESQLLIRLVCKHGVKKTYKLQYEQCQTMHALTDRSLCHNRFTIPARALKDVMDHFAPRAEELTLAVNDGNLLLTSFTEGIINDREVLKQPIHTSITIDNREFDVMEVDEDIQITFGLREFKSIGYLCDLLGTDVAVYYSDAGKPLLVDFEKDGMSGSFVVATTADGASVPIQTNTGRQPRTMSDLAKSTERVTEPSMSFHIQEDPSITFHHQAGSTHNASHLSPEQSPPAFDRSTLFAPESHTQDHHEEDLSRQDAYEDDELQLYADEAYLSPGEEVMEFGPTQTQSANKPKGLFD